MTTDEMITDVLRREGWPKVTDRVSDRGGLTKGGVTLKSYNGWLTEHGHRPLLREEFINITEEQARVFYAAVFFEPLEFIRAQSESVFLEMADWAVISGPDDPIRALQQSLAARNLYPGIIDGVAGRKTRAAWHQLPQAPLSFQTEYESIREEIRARRVIAHVMTALDTKARAFLATTPNTQLHNLEGWIRRAVSHKQRRSV